MLRRLARGAMSVTGPTHGSPEHALQLAWVACSDAAGAGRSMRERGEWDQLAEAAADAGAENVMSAMKAMEAASEVSEDAYANAVRQLTSAVRAATDTKVLDARRQVHASHGAKLPSLVALFQSRGKGDLAQFLNVEVFVADAQKSGACMHARSDPYHGTMWCVSEAGHGYPHVHTECVACDLADRFLETAGP